MGSVPAPTPTHPNHLGQHDSALNLIRVATAARRTAIPWDVRFDGE